MQKKTVSGKIDAPSHSCLGVPPLSQAGGGARAACARTYPRSKRPRRSRYVTLACKLGARTLKCPEVRAIDGCPSGNSAARERGALRGRGRFGTAFGTLSGTFWNLEKILEMYKVALMLSDGFRASPRSKQARTPYDIAHRHHALAPAVSSPLALAQPERRRTNDKRPCTVGVGWFRTGTPLLAHNSKVRGQVTRRSLTNKVSGSKPDELEK